MTLKTTVGKVEYKLMIQRYIASYTVVFTNYIAHRVTYTNPQLNINGQRSQSALRTHDLGI